MKKGITPGTLLLLTLLLQAQPPEPVLVSLSGIGRVKVGMKQPELEKLLHATLSLQHVYAAQPQPDTVGFMFEGISYKVVLAQGWAAQQEQEIVVYAVMAESPQLRTPAGIGIGTDKLAIVRAYADYTLHLMPERSGDPPHRQANRSLLILYGEDTPTSIIFYLYQDKVVGFCVQYSEGC